MNECTPKIWLLGKIRGIRNLALKKVDFNSKILMFKKRFTIKLIYLSLNYF
jgi:hypothetical protein